MTRLIAIALAAIGLSAGTASACGGFFDVACNVGKVIEKATQDTGKAIEKATHDTGKAIEKATQDVGKTIESVAKNPVEILPVCWGEPQTCRDENKKKITVPVAAPTYSASFRVRCVDAVSGADRGDNTVTVTSTVSREAAVNEILRLYRTTDLCQANGDTSRRMVPGSGEWRD
jgi:hypothetical protein